MSTVTAQAMRYADLVAAIAAGKYVATDVVAATLSEAGMTREDLDEHVEQRRARSPAGRPGGYASGGDPIARWNSAVAEKVDAGMSRAEAVRALVREQPELHESYLAAYNAQHKRQR